MPRKHGARAVGDAIKRIAKSKGVPHSGVTLGQAQSRTSARQVRTPRKSVPGAKVRLRPNETVKMALRRMAKISGSNSAGKIGKGTTRKRH